MVGLVKPASENCKAMNTSTVYNPRMGAPVLPFTKFEMDRFRAWYLARHGAKTECCRQLREFVKDLKVRNDMAS